MISVHAEISDKSDIIEAHELIDNVEHEISEKMGCEAVIHMDPICTTDPETNLIRERVSKIISDISSEYSSPISMHDFRVVKGYCSQTKILFDVSISNEMPISNEQLYKEILEELKKINPLFLLILTVDRDYFSERYED